MADVIAPSAAPAPASSTPESAAPTPAAPAANPASDAARTLAHRRAEIRAKLANGSPEKTPPNPASASPAAPEAQTAQTPAPKPEPTGDEDVDRELQRLMQEDRRVKDADKAVQARETAVKRLEPYVPRIEAFEKHLAAGDTVGAVKAILGDAKLSNDFMWSVLRDLGENGEGAENEPPDVKDQVAQALAEREKAAKEEAERKKTEHRSAITKRIDAVDGKLGRGFGEGVLGLLGATEEELDKATPDEVGDLIEAQGEWVTATAQVLARNKEKYPLVTAIEIPPVRVVKATEALRKDLKRQPTTGEVLQRLEDEMAGAVKTTPYARPEEPPAPRPVASATSSWRTDPGTPAPAQADAPRLTLDQKRAERKKRLLGAA